MSAINLLPKDYLERRAKRRANALCLGLFVIVMGGVLGGWMVSERNTRRTQEILDRLDNEYAQAARLISQMQCLQQQQRELHRKANMTSSLVERVPRSTVLAAVTNARPENLALLELKLTTENKRPTAKATPKKRTKFAAAAKKRAPQVKVRQVVKLTITGLAGTDVDVARFMENLANYKLIQSVDLVETKLKEVDEQTVREFEITAKLAPEVDAIDVVQDIRRQRPVREKRRSATAWWKKLGGRS